jgi:acyl-CoA reductase-like NAD-dependent aldehyde dehydrogenase
MNTEHPSASETIEVANPRTGEDLYSVSESGEEDICGVYERARAAFVTISAMSVRERVGETLKLKRYIFEHREEIVDRICSETGKSRTDCLLTEIFPVLNIIEYYKKNAEKILADRKVHTPIVLFPKKSKVFYEPIGPVLIISPWNYPFNLTMAPFLCAFLAGNPVVFKPSEYTPLRGLIEKVFDGCSFTKDAMQVVYGGKETGARLIDHRPAKICFTGSCRGGREVMAHAAQYLIPVELELGGKDPMVVFEDVNIERTVNGALWGSMTNSGQTCTAAERVIVHESIYADFVDQLKKKAETITTPSRGWDSGDDRDLDMGCMTTGFQVDKVVDQLRDAKAKGAEIITGGDRVDGRREIVPTIVCNVNDGMKIANEETFGPVMTVQSFKTEREAIDLANDSPYGLSASVWSADLKRAERVARSIVTGNVSINNVLATQSNPALPFGGTKESGFGRYLGPFGLHSFSNVKSILVDKQGNNPELYWYPYSKKKYELFSSLIGAMVDGGFSGLIRTALVGLKLEKLSKTDRL